MNMRKGRIASRVLAVLMATSAFPALANTITGTVVDDTGTRPLAGAEVRISGVDRVAQVDGEGRFRITGVPAGTYDVTVRFAGAEPSTKSVTVVDGGEQALAFAMAPEGAGSMILVMGQQATLLSSIARQRTSDTVTTVLTRDSIGQFPDQNVAESLRRAPGINVLNDQGEGRFVSVRGLAPGLNSSSINGNRVLSTGGDNRDVALDVVPNELIESIEIKKSLTPDMDGDTIGGSIDIQTTSAFDRKKGFIGLVAEGGYNELSEEWSPKFSSNFSQPITENFGIAGGASWNRRRYATDNIEADGWVTGDNGVDYAEDLEYRDYDVQRNRWGGNLSLDWRPSSTTTLYLRGLYSKFDDTELRRRLVFGFDAEPASSSDNAVTFDSADGRIQVRRDLKDRREVQSIATVSAGGKTETGPWTITYDVARSYADQQENGSIDPIRFQRRFQTPGALGVTVDYDDLQRPAYNINFGSAGFLNPGGYGLTLLERTTREDAKDKEWSFRTDIAREIALDGGDLEIKAGGKVRLRDKRQNFIIDLFEDVDGGLTLADVLGSQTYTLADLGPLPDLALVRAFAASTPDSQYERNDLESDFVGASESFRAKEDIYAGYVQGRLDTGAIRVIGGVRVEHTKQNLTGSRTDIVEEGGTRNGVVLDEDTLFVTPVNFQRSYTNVLPSFNLRANLSPKVVARLGAFRSLSRPSFGKLAPRFTLSENEDGEREGSFGNPDLRPYKAWNFDATLEYYFSNQSVIQGGLFYKKITDFIVDTRQIDGTFAGIDFTEADIPLNGDDAEVFGAEFSYSQAFTTLPAPFDGLVTSVNYTYTNARGEILGRRIPLPQASKHTANFVLGYEKGPISLRAAASYRDQFLDELGEDAEADRYVRPLFQIDLSAKYRVNKAFQLFFEVVNLNNADFTAYRNGPTQRRLLQFETYQRTFKGGVRANF
ncbi:MAG: TonB-dependent receptor [Novosphingobium sp. 17-62-19]|uniref:TonB-dependent receptor n=1 Tax=Novosphingobium sp. 17-62-19 TaxID=1970406 RepID=UPI000BC6FF6A|nr:TonB-dependent receptor [Novosphingobium sp. 17-62-19]OZA21072.1 MAG: TonB-dependent receptor [Novosphingobium sp. 17-62-19]HQS97584.1 TonB-dependent receptor [Novosphingobium sp.]